jgi:opine dehydrogenase
MRIAVLGGGNGSFAAAGDVALAGHEVRLWRRDAGAVEAHVRAGGAIVIKDFQGRHEARPALITGVIGAAVRGAELIVCPAPATAQPDIARELGPHIEDGPIRPSARPMGTRARPAAAAISMTAVVFASPPSMPNMASTGIPTGPVTRTRCSLPPVRSTRASVKPSPPSTIGTSRMRAVGMARLAPAAMARVTAGADRASLSPEGATRTVSDGGSPVMATVSAEAPVPARCRPT